MTTMKALLFERYRPPSILSIQQSPVPNLRTGEAPVELHASAISPSEVKNVADAFKASCRAFRGWTLSEWWWPANVRGQGGVGQRSWIWHSRAKLRLTLR
jgi:hypothetical protein